MMTSPTPALVAADVSRRIIPVMKMVPTDVGGCALAANRGKRSLSGLALLSALLLSSGIVLVGAPSTNDLAGNWKGALEVGQAKLRFLFKISRTPAGVLTTK
jgi:hypothetical protein